MTNDAPSDFYLRRESLLLWLMHYPPLMPSARRNEQQMNNNSITKKQDQDQDEPLYDPRGLQYVEPSQTSLQCSVCCEYFTEPVSAPCG